MTVSFVAMHTPAPVRTWLAAKSPNERRVIVGIAALVALVLLWVIAWEPLQRDVRRLRAQHEAERNALSAAHGEVDEITTLQRATSPVPGDIKAAVQQSLVASGLRNLVTDIQWPQGRAQLTFAAVEFGTLARWLEGLQRDSGIIVKEATLSARVEPGSVRAELVLGR